MWGKVLEYRDTIIIAVAAFLIGFGVASLVGERKDTTVYSGTEDERMESGNGEGAATGVPQPGSAAPPSVSTASGYEISVANQRAGGGVVLARAVLMEAGWVAIREDADGRPGNILGAGWLPDGTHENTTIELLRGTVGGEKYYAVLYADMGGDKAFDHTVDTPRMSEKGEVILVSFMTLASPEGF